jgi:hypothetical protein
VRRRITNCGLVLALIFFWWIIPVSSAAQTEQSKTSPSGASSPGQSAKPSSSAHPSAAEIAAAKASGKVWVNLNTGIYHRRGRWYGKTKNGKFMTPEEAKKAGYKPAKRD